MKTLKTALFTIFPLLLAVLAGFTAALLINNRAEKAFALNKNVIIAVDAKESFYGEKILPLTYSLEGDALSKEELSALAITLDVNDLSEVGTYPIIVSFTQKDGIDVSVKTADYKVLTKVFDTSALSFSDRIFDYDGEYHSLTLTGVLPKEIVVEYKNNHALNAGEYDVSATLTCPGNAYAFYGDTTFSARMTINKTPIDVSSLTFEDETYFYDEQFHSISVKGDLPKGVAVNYTANGFRNAGQYSLIANILYDKNNFYLTDGQNAVDDVLRATLIIKKSQSKIVVERDSYVFVYGGHANVFPYTVIGEPYENVVFVVNGIPYPSRTITDIGEYEVKLYTTGTQNYTAAPSVTVKVSVRPYVIDNLTRNLVNNEVEGKLFCDGGIDNGSTLYVSFVAHPVAAYPRIPINKKVLGSYTVRVLSDNGNDLQAKSTVLIKCNYAPNAEVWYYDVSGNLRKVAADYNSDGFIIFDTDTLGEFLIVCNTDSSILTLLLLISVILLIILYIVIRLVMRRPRKLLIHYPEGDKEYAIIPDQIVMLPMIKDTLSATFEGLYSDKNYAYRMDDIFAMPSRDVEIFIKFTDRTIPSPVTSDALPFDATMILRGEELKKDSPLTRALPTLKK